MLESKDNLLRNLLFPIFFSPSLQERDDLGTAHLARSPFRTSGPEPRFSRIRRRPLRWSRCSSCWDSTVDCGTNNYLGTLARADHLPVTAGISTRTAPPEGYATYGSSSPAPRSVHITLPPLPLSRLLSEASLVRRTVFGSLLGFLPGQECPTRSRFG